MHMIAGHATAPVVEGYLVEKASAKELEDEAKYAFATLYYLLKDNKDVNKATSLLEEILDINGDVT